MSTRQRTQKSLSSSLKSSHQKATRSRPALANRTSRKWVSQQCIIDMRQSMVKQKFILNHRLAMDVYFFPFGIQSETREGDIASYVTLSKADNTLLQQPTNSYIAIQWWAAGMAHIHIISFLDLQEAQSTSMIGFHSLFHRDFILQNEQKIEISMQLINSIQIICIQKKQNVSDNEVYKIPTIG